jgi:hypothetical protein
MQKYILYSFLVIFAFSSASFGGKEDEEDRSSNVSQIRVKEIPWDLLIKAGRPGGLSPQTHLSPDKKYDPPSPSYTRGKTFYVSREALRIIFENNP